MKHVDRDDKEIVDGDIIDIHQTVNGCNLFIVHIKRLDGENVYSATYYMNGRDYEYDVMELIGITQPFDTQSEIQIVGNVHKGGIYVEKRNL